MVEVSVLATTATTVMAIPRGGRRIRRGHNGWRMVGFGCQEGLTGRNPTWMAVSARPFDTPHIGANTGLPTIVADSKTGRLLLRRVCGPKTTPKP
jgi:hypothetical protein